MSKFKIIITEDAKDDIKDIINYIQLQNQFAAINLLKIFRKTFVLLADFPSAGKMSYLITDKTILIYILKKRFIIAYRFQNNEVSILRVLSSYQNIYELL